MSVPADDLLAPTREQLGHKRVERGAVLLVERARPRIISRRAPRRSPTGGRAHHGRLHEHLARREQRADLVIGHGVQRRLTLNVVADELNHHQEREHEHEPHEPQRQGDDLLHRRHRKHDGDDRRHRDADDERAALQARIPADEPRGMVGDMVTEILAVGKHAHELGDAETALGQVHLFAVDDIGALNLAREHTDKVREVRSQSQPDRQEDREEDPQVSHKRSPFEAVEPGNRLTQGVDAVSEREERVDELEERRGHLDRVQTRRARNLHEDQDDADALADMLQGGRQRQLDSQVRKRCEHRRQEEQRHRLALHADGEAPDAAHDCLQRHHPPEEQVARDVALSGREVLDTLVVHLDAHDHHEHEHANPQRHVDEQWRHARAVRVQGEEVLGLHLSRRLHEARHLLGVDRRAVAEEIGDRRRGLQRHEVSLHCVDARLQVGKHAIGLVKRASRRRERLGKLARERNRLVDEHTLRRCCCSKIPHRDVQVPHARIDGGERVGRERPAIGVRVRDGSLHGGVHRVGRRRDRLGHAAHVGAHVGELGERLRGVRVRLLQPFDRLLEARLVGIVVVHLGNECLHLSHDRLARRHHGVALGDRAVDAPLRLGHGTRSAADGRVHLGGRLGKEDRPRVHRAHKARCQLRDVRLRGAHERLDNEHLAAQIVEHLVRVGEQRGSVGHLRLRLVGRVAKPLDGIAGAGDRLLRLVDPGEGVRVRIVDLALRDADFLAKRVGDRFRDGSDERGVDRGVERVRARVGDLRRHGVHLLVHVVFKLRLLEVAGEQREQVG